LRALLPVATYETPVSGVSLDQLTIDDAPRYAYRGMHLDMARNFESKETVFKLLNLMAYYKLNYFHMHLSEALSRPEITILWLILTTQFGLLAGVTMRRD
jgi:hexosaminidase